MKKRLIGLVSGLAVVSTLALTLFFVTNPFVAADAVADIALRPALTVSVTAPRTETLPVRLTANGDIAAWQEAIIGSDVTDLRLAEVRVNVGDAVRKGEVLAVFDDATVKIEVAQAEAALAEAEALVVEAEENARRARSLDKTGALSAQQILQYVTAAETAKARGAAARAQLEARWLRLQRARVRSPDDGVISARNATLGAVVGVGGELFRMVRQGRLEWRAELASSELERVRVGMPVSLLLPGKARVHGTVRAIAPTVNASRRMGLAYVDLPSGASGSPARPGMFARGEFELGTSPALTVPQEAVVMREAFTYVFLLGDDGRARQQKVSTGRRVDARVELLEGVDDTARIIVSGAGFLNDGDLVRVVDADVDADVDAGADADAPRAKAAP